MLALTTYLEPRNLLIDLAFLGLSTITREWPPPPRAGTSPAPALRRGLLGERDVDAGRRALAAERVSWGFRFRSASFLRTFLPRYLPTYPLPIPLLRSILLDLHGRGALGRLRLPWGGILVRLSSGRP